MSEINPFILSVRFPRTLAWAPYLYAALCRIHDAKNEAVRACDKKYIGAASVPSGADETSRERRPLDLRSRKPSKSTFLKFPLRADRKNQLLKFFRPLKF